MRCKACDYPLWNLKTRSCPECGKPFLPSEFEFVTDSVRFCCPHCSQSYYGTGDKGHLVPDSFQCVTCARQISMDEMVLLPTEGVHEERTRVDVVPWLERSRRGWIKGWFGTVGMALATPVRLAQALPADVASTQAGGFALLTSCVFGSVGCLILLVPFMVMAMQFGGSWRGLTTILGFLLGIPVGLAAVILLWTLSAHLILRLTGKTQHGISRTFVCVCFGSGANVLMAIPCVGAYFLPLTWVWWSISSAFMLAIVQRVSRWRAFVATILPPTLILAGAVASVVFVIIPGVTSSIATAQASVASAQGASAMTKAVAELQRYAAMNKGALPTHALELVASGRLQSTDLLSVESMLNLGSNSSSAGHKLMDFESLAPEEQSAQVNDAVKAFPGGAVAHRLGDIVFVYHGIDLSPGSSADPGLWLAIWAPVLGKSGTQTSNSPQNVIVGTTAGTVTIPKTAFVAKLAEQNTLRAGAGLAALPDPFTVIEPSPAIPSAPGAAPK